MNYTVANPTKIGCYTQSRNLKTLSAAKSALGADVIVNFQLFDMGTYKHALALKVDGQVLTTDPSPYWGYAWNNNDTKLTLVRATEGMQRYDNFAGSVLVCKDGKPITNPEYGVLFPYTRGRTCIGRKANGDIVIYCWPDGSAGACTIGQLGAKMVALGCVDAINYDGGGSCQIICPDGKVYSSRYVASMLWFKLPQTDAAPAPSQSSANPTVVEGKEAVLEEGYRLLFYGKMKVDRGTWAKQHGLTPYEFQSYINKRWPNAPKRI